jgi:hypothetical protein
MMAQAHVAGGYHVVPGMGGPLSPPRGPPPPDWRSGGGGGGGGGGGALNFAQPHRARANGPHRARGGTLHRPV